MIKKLLYIAVFFIILLSLSQTLVLGSYLFGKNKEVAVLVKNAIVNIVPSLYQHALNSSIYYNGNYGFNKMGELDGFTRGDGFTTGDSVDIVTLNHISSVDFMIVASIVRQFDDRPVYFLIKKQVTMIPGVGFILLSDQDIKLNRKMEEDYDNITNTIKKITSGIIIIMPEGTRYTPEKHKLAIEYSTKNGLDVFNNTLYPKMKGLWTICDILKKNNKIGHIIDISIVIENFRNKQIFISDILTAKKPFGNTLCQINSYRYPYDIESYDDFKKWFIPIWKIKDNALSQMSLDVSNYKKLNVPILASNYILLVVIVSLAIYLTINTNGLYLLFSLIVSYLVTFAKYF
jgi:1-acyl-sn-glycerol-3-phosphate acyltransferase